MSEKEADLEDFQRIQKYHQEELEEDADFVDDRILTFQSMQISL